MQTRPLTVTAWILVGIIACGQVRAADKITISYSSRSYAFLPAQVAVAKGFFEDENLAVDRTFEFAIEARKATVKSEKSIPLSQVRDCSPVKGGAKGIAPPVIHCGDHTPSNRA
jgi:hypothetical protein